MALFSGTDPAPAQSRPEARSLAQSGTISPGTSSGAVAGGAMELYVLNAGTISLPMRRMDLSTSSRGMRPISWLAAKMS